MILYCCPKTVKRYDLAAQPVMIGLGGRRRGAINECICIAAWPWREGGEETRLCKSERGRWDLSAWRGIALQFISSHAARRLPGKTTALGADKALALLLLHPPHARLKLPFPTQTWDDEGGDARPSGDLRLVGAW